MDTPHQLFRIISDIALLAKERTYAWRGQNDASWDLSASLLREIRNKGGEVTEELAGRKLGSPRVCWTVCVIVCGCGKGVLPNPRPRS